jgi:hypothetical protein
MPSLAELTHGDHGLGVGSHGMRDGAPVSGGEVRIPIRFVLPKA